MRISWRNISALDMRKLAEVQRGFLEDLGFKFDVRHFDFGDDNHVEIEAEIKEWPTVPDVEKVLGEIGITSKSIESWAAGSPTLTVQRALELAKQVSVYDVRLGTGYF